MNQGFGKDFYRKGNSVKRSGHSLNRRTLKTEKLLSSSPSRKPALRLLDFQGRGGIISVVWWNLRPVIFGVD